MLNIKKNAVSIKNAIIKNELRAVLLKFFKFGAIKNINVKLSYADILKAPSTKTSFNPFPKIGVKFVKSILGNNEKNIAINPAIINGVIIALVLNIPCKPIAQPMKTVIKNSAET